MDDRLAGPDRGEVRVSELIIPVSPEAELMPDVSVIVPVTERPEPLAELFLEYSEPLAETGRLYEFLFLVEPRNRTLVEPLRKLADRGQPIRVFEVGHAVGESVLLKLGATRSRADTVIVLPAYRRVEAAALPELVARVKDGADLVNARRHPRSDSWLNRLQTRVLHTLVAGLSSGRLRDVGSGVRAMKRELLSEIPLYGDFFRFLPVIAVREGYEVEEIDAPQHAGDARRRSSRPTSCITWEAATSGPVVADSRTCSSTSCSRARNTFRKVSTSVGSRRRAAR